VKKPPLVPPRSGGKKKTDPARRKKRPPFCPPVKGGKKKVNPLDIARARGWRPPDAPGPKKKKLKTRDKGLKPALPLSPVDFRPKWNPTRQKFYESARILYVEQGYSQAAIQRKLKLCQRTLSNWKREGQWEVQREVKQQGPQALIADVELALKKLVEDLGAHIRAGNRPWKGAADEVNKFVNVVERLRGDAYFAGHLTKTLELLTEYLRVSEKNELVKSLMETLPGFTVWALSRKS